MSRVLGTLFSAAFLVSASVVTGRAAEAPTESPSGGASPILAPEAQPEAARSKVPARPRLVSPEIAARLAEAAPKFTPPQPTRTPDAAPETPAETDQPRNAIIRLPRYVVEGSKVRVPREWSVMTPKARVEFAYKNFPGLRFGSFWIFKNDTWATEMLAEDLALERRRKMADLMGFLTDESDAPKARELRRVLQEMQMRDDTWTATGGSVQQQKR